MRSLLVLLVRVSNTFMVSYALGLGGDEKICPTSVLPVQMTKYQHPPFMSISSASGGMHFRSIYNWWINEKSSLLWEHGQPFLLRDLEGVGEVHYGNTLLPIHSLTVIPPTLGQDSYTHTHTPHTYPSPTKRGYYVL